MIVASMTVAWAQVVMMLTGMGVTGDSVTRQVSRSRAVADEDFSRELSAFLDTVRLEYRVPAIAAAVVRGQNIVAAAAVGSRVVGQIRPVELGDRFHVGSVTKPMTATMIATLVEEGRLSWRSTPAAVFSEAGHRIDPSLRNVTLEMLLSHWAGIPAFTDDQEFSSVPKFTGSAVERRKLFVAWLLSQQPASKPGTQHRYSNAGYTIAAAMAERVTGQSWEDLMRERLFKPLGMSSAGFDWPAVSDPNQPWGHRSTSGGYAPHSPNDEYHVGPLIAPAGDVHVSIEDLARFVRAHLRALTGHPSLLSTGTALRLHTAVNQGDYGLGWNIREFGDTHIGGAGTFFASILVSPANDVALVMAMNAGTSDDATIASRIFSRFYNRKPR